jgi:hypothetical protein
MFYLSLIPVKNSSVATGLGVTAFAVITTTQLIGKNADRFSTPALAVGRVRHTD